MQIFWCEIFLEDMKLQKNIKSDRVIDFKNDLKEAVVKILKKWVCNSILSRSESSSDKKQSNAKHETLQFNERRNRKLG